jgi:hypothetical protein
MFNVYYIRNGYELNAKFETKESAFSFAYNFVHMLNGDYAAITDIKTNKTIQIYSKW